MEKIKVLITKGRHKGKTGKLVGRHLMPGAFYIELEMPEYFNLRTMQDSEETETQLFSFYADSFIIMKGGAKVLFDEALD